MVVIPGIDGDMGVLAEHAATVSTLRPGIVSVHNDINGPAVKRVFVQSGVAEISARRCIILAEEAADLADLDKSTVQTRLTEAEAALNAAASEGEKSQALAELNIARAQATALA